MKSANSLLGSLLFVFLVVMACFFLIGACSSKNSNTKDPSGIKTEERKVDSFTSVQANGHGDINISVQEACNVSVTALEKELSQVSTAIKDDTLVIEVSDNQVATTPRISIGLPKLETIDINGAWKVKIDDIKSPSLKVSVDGASNLTCAGTCDDLACELSGASELQARSLVCKNCDLNLEGACKARVSVKDSLKLDASDASKVEIDGNPPELTKNLSGAATVTQNGDSGE